MSARRFSVTLDSDLLDEAVRVTGSASQREAIETALEELVRRRRLDALAARAGRVPLTVTVDDLLRSREEA
jgi:Arc/MetJ family transcription regulator